ncbi:MAG: hypothetical protein AB7F96_04340 [Beijerinckiaceae bacterium]
MKASGVNIIRAAAELSEFAMTCGDAPIEAYIANAERVYKRHGLTTATDKEAASLVSGASIEVLTKHTEKHFGRTVAETLLGWSRGSNAVN